ncbi:hypothetical protein BH09CHL1_BH09CHL1_02110 [soil metagenome]
MPEPSRMQLPESYGDFEPYTLESAPDWDEYEVALVRAKNYWLVLSGTTSPVVAPVWGLWADESFIFSTEPGSRKGRALSGNPRCVVHLDSGDDVTIVHGTAERLELADAIPYLSAYETKYGVAIDLESADTAVYRVTPSFALTWLERDFITTATRWEF